MNVSLRISTPANYATATTSTNSFAHLGMPSLLRWFFVFMMLGYGTVNAQLVANYPFAQSSGTYTPITGGTDPLGLTTWDDQTATNIPIGFSFTFNGTVYTTANLNANGYITFGASAAGGSTPISSSAGSGVISAFGRDIINNGTSITYQTNGTAGSRVFTMQWENARRYNGGAVDGDVLNFQIRLLETSNVVEIVYGTCTATSTTALTSQVGLRGATSADFNNRISATSWSATLAGTSNTDAVTSSNTIMPASGLTFSYSVPAPCVAPTAQPGLPFNFTPVGLTQLNGSFAAASPAPSGYLVVRTTVNVAPAPVDGTVYAPGSNAIGFIETVSGTTFSSTGLTPSTTYYYWAFSFSNTGCSGGPLYLTTSPLTTSATTGACSITGTKTVGGGGADYQNLTQAIAALVANGASGNVILELNSTYPGAGETFPIVLGVVPCAGAGNTITIRLAAGAGAKTITSASTLATIDINGGNYWIIDGRQGGTGSSKDLTIANTSTTLGGTAIRFINEASNNTVKYTVLKAAFASATSGVIVFSNTTGANGNDNNTIDNNNIDGLAGLTASPTTAVSQNGIYASGSTGTTAQNNSGNIISNNNIFDYFVAGASQTSAGILVGGGNTEWTINANSIYQTNPRTTTGTVNVLYGMFINSSSGNNFTITNNFIGGRGSSASGAAWTYNGAFTNRFSAMSIRVGTTTASNIQGNTITNFNTSTTSATATLSSLTTALAGTWGGIVVGAGNTNITGNTIGSSSSTGAITVSSSTTGGAVIGIAIGGTGVNTVSNNSIGSITTLGSTVSIGHSIIAINTDASGVAVTTVSNNTMGSATTQNSLFAANANTNTSTQFINGVSNTNSGTVNITDNLVANLTNATIPSSSTGSQLRGITSTSGFATITGNTVRSMKVSAFSTGAATPSVAGIFVSSTTTLSVQNVSNNSIHTLQNGHPSAAVQVTGLYFSGVTTTSHIINRNNIYGLRIGSSSATASLNGIVIAGGSSTFQNNTIRLGYDSAGTALTDGINMVGIDKTSATNNNIYHNTVVIGGTGVLTSVAHSFAFRKTGTATDDVRNNIFINQRSNNVAGTGKHYAIGLNAITTLTLNYNIYYGTGTGFQMGYVGTPGTTDYATLAAWKLANPALDVNSKDLDPCLSAPLAALPNLHLTNCATLGSPADGGGVLIAAVTDDMDGQVRAGLSPVDMGADAGDYGPAGVDVGITAVVRPTATSCHSAAEDVIVTLKNFSTTMLDMAVTPVTITTNVTGQVTAGPLTITVNTGTLNPGASQNYTVGTVDASANGTYTFNSTASAAGDVTPGNDGNVTNVVINYVPLSVAATSGAASICLSGATTLLATPTGGTAPFTYLWDAGTTPTTAANNTGTITTTTTYNVTVTDACGITATNNITVIVSTPTITGTTPGSRCGAGTVNLSAAASPVSATIKWYAAPTGGTVLFTGANFTTPTINTTTPYYVAASEGGGTATVGAVSPTAQGGTIGTQTVDWDVNFTTFAPTTLVSIDIYPITAGQAGVLQVRAGSGTGGTLLATINYTTTVSGGATVQTIPINYAIATPGNYALYTDLPTSGVSRNTTGAVYPYTSAIANITSNGFDQAYFMGMYNWSFSSGCESSRTAVIATVVTPPAITAVATPAAICVGQSSTLSVTSPNDPNYTYVWTPAGPGTVSPTTTTTYTVVATDNTTGNPSSGCSITQSVTVTVNALPVVTATSSAAALCPGGTINLSASTGGGIILSENFNGTAAGWNITSDISSPTQCNWYYQAAPLTDAAGSATFLNFTTQNGGKFALSNSDAGGSGSVTNSVLTSPSFSTAGLSAATISFEHAYQLWSGDQKVQVDISTDGGTTWVLLADYKGTNVGIVTNNAQTTADASINLSAYLNQPNLKFRFNYVSGWGYYWIIDDVQVTGTASPHTFVWSSTPSGFNSTDQNPMGVVPAVPTSYQVIATNVGNGCVSASATTPTISISDLAVTSVVTTNVSCFGAATGSVTATATGGTGTYAYTIAGPTVNTSGATSGIFTGLLAGSYTVTVTDAAPCSVVSNSVSVSEPAQLALSVTASTDPVCNNGETGTITVAGGGGTGTLSYTISGPTINTSGATSGAFTGLLAGAYIITVTDANGCTATTTETLDNPALLPISATNNGPVCSGSPVTLTATPGTYATYQWTGPVTITNSTSAVATAIPAADGDIFTVTITDINGCTNSASTTVSVSPNLPVSVSVATAPATSVCSGTTLTFTATPVNGGTTPTYQWYVNAVAQTGETNPTFITSTLNNNDAVHVVLTSNEVCTSGNPASSTPVVIEITGSIEASVVLVAGPNPICDGSTITLTATPTGGGTSPTYDFYVNGVSVQNGASNIYTYVPAVNDNAFVIMTSSYSCATGSPAVSNTELITVNPVPAAPVVTAGGATTFCTGGSVTLTSSYSGVGHQWFKDGIAINLETNDNLVVTTSGSYTVTYTALGCTSPVSNAIVVTVNASAVVINATPGSSICNNQTATLTAVATPVATSYLWSPGGEITNAITVSLAGTYSVTTTDANGCTATASVSVIVNDAPTVSISGNSTICTGTSEILTATATAGSGTITSYQWVLNGTTNVGTNSATYAATVAGSYTVVVTNSNGCITTSAAFVLAATGPLSGTYTIGSGGASCSNYVTLAAAITDLNTKGVAGNVIFDIASGYTETAPTGGYSVNLCGLADILKPSASQTVTFQGGATAAVITAFVGTGVFDAMVKIVGADYITFDKVNLAESAGNITATTQMEAGYALVKCNGTDGANSNTISNSSITLNKTNTSSVGIYMNNHDGATTTTLVYTGAATVADSAKYRSSNNQFFGNAIQNVYRGVQLIGSGVVEFYDVNNSVGTTIGNTITNFGGGSAAVQTMGVFGTFQSNPSILNNTITGGTGATGAQVNGIQYGNSNGGTISANTISVTSSNTSTSGSTIGIFSLAGGTTSTVTITNNIVENTTLTTTSSFSGILTQLGLTAPLNIVMTGNTVRNISNTATTGIFTGISNTIAATGTVTMSNNTVQNNSISGTSVFTGLTNTASAASLVMNNNTITGNTKGNTGTMTLLNFATPVLGVINNNSITNNAVSATTLGNTVTLNCAIGSGTFGVTNYTFSGNTISNNRVQGMSGTSVATVSGYTNAGSSLGETITNNIISNLFVTGATTPSTGVQVIRGFNNNPVSSTVRSLGGNTIFNLYSAANMNAAITGIISSANQSANIFNNKIYDLYPGQNGTGASVVKGISVIGGTLTNVYNNMIGIDLGNATTNAVNGVLVGSNSMVGIEVTGGTTSRLSFNTIRLAGNGATGTFGTSGISITSTTPTVDIRNNIVVNLTTGGGTAAANTATGLRRSATALTGYAATSNNNVWFTGIPSATRSMYYDGTTAYQTLATFKTQVATRESLSQTENISFQSTVGGNANFQKVSTATATVVEGGAQSVSGITDDYFGTVRNTSGPDIGAHEDNFINLNLSITSVSISPSAPQCVPTARTVTVVVDPAANPVTSVTLNYAFAGVVQTPIVLSNGGSGDTYTGILPAAPQPNKLVTWSVTATDGFTSAVGSGASYTDAYFDGYTMSATANPTTVCSGSASVLTAVTLAPPLAAPDASLYCVSTHTSGCSGDDITLVTLGNINNITTGCGGIDQYTYFNGGGTETTTIPATVPQTLSVSFGTDGSQFFGAWIDYNHNGIYDATEFLGASANAGASGTIGVTFTVPVTALNGLTHMRIVGGNDAAVTSAQACGASSSAFGETQDYDVTITGGAAGSIVPSNTFTSYAWSDGTSTVATGNPGTVNPLATTTYTVTGTDVNGCTVTSTPVTVSIVPLVCTNITTSTATCASGFTLTANTTGGGAPYSYAWSDGSATVYPTTQTITTGILVPGDYTFTVTVTDGCGGSCTMSTIVTVDPLPTVSISVNPASALFCGGTATMTASGAATYTWAPAAGLNTTTGSVVIASPSVTTTYTVTGTDANGCINTATQLITSEAPIIINATGTPTTLCAGGNVQLNSTLVTAVAEYYNFSSSTGVALADTTGSTQIINTSNDDTPATSQLIGFTFQYEGTDYTRFSVSPDGFIHLRNTTGAATSDFSNDMASPTNDPSIAPLWDDHATGTSGHVKMLVSGTSPNRVLVLHWFVTAPRNTTGAANSNFQALLYEGTNKIEFRYGSIGLLAPVNEGASVGLASASVLGRFLNITTSSNTASSTVVNNTNPAAPAAGTMYSFTYTQPAITLAWTPTTNLNDPTIANPLATNVTGSVNYVLTATRTATGCFVTDTVVVTVNAVPAATFTGLAATYCSSASAVTLTGTPANGTFTGPGISGNSFTPSAAGPGTHTITYSVTDPSSGCSNSTSQTVTVTQPIVTFTTLDPSYCTTSASVILTGNQAPGGTFTGAGITNNGDGTAIFNPATAGPGAHPITYSFTDGGGCSNSQVQTANVTAASSATIAYSGSPYCSNAGNATVSITGTTGGSFSSTTGLVIQPVSGTVDLAASTAGTYTVTYSIAANGACPLFTTTTSITITAAPSATFSYAGPYCSNGETADVTFTGTTGGTYSSTAGLNLNPSSGQVTLAGSTPGTYTVTYTVAASGGCPVYTTTASIVITPAPAATIAYAGSPYCSTDLSATVTFTGTTGGTYTAPSGLTINALTGEVNPSTSTPGTYVVTYTVAASGGCLAYTTTASITIQTCATTVTLNLKAYLEGFYTGGGTMVANLFNLGLDPDATATDNISVNLWSVANLSNPLPDYTVTALLHTDGTATVTLPGAVSGNSFYIAIRHRNSMETWTKTPVSFTSVTSYDFSTGLLQAYDDGINPPMADMGGVFALYGGDVNQDFTIDGSDANDVEINTDLFAFGYDATDANGDGATDGQDANIVEINTNKFLFYARPF